MIKKFSKIYSFIPKPLRSILALSLKSVSLKNWIKINNLSSKLNRHRNFEDKIYKVANVLEAENISDYYYRLRTNWINPTEVVIDSKEPGTLLTEFKPKLKELNNQQQMMVLDLLTYLPDDILVKVDRAAMASSLETRVPFLDHKLIEYIWKIPHNLKFQKGNGKIILKNILNQYVPQNLTERPKMGFGIPIDVWLRGPLRDWAENLLNEKKIKQDNYFNAKLIKNKWNDHISGKRNWQYHLWDILMFQAWKEANNY